MKSIILLSALTLVVCDYLPAKPSEPFNTPASHASKYPPSTPFSDKNHLAHSNFYLPLYYPQSYPLSHLNSFYPRYYNRLNRYKNFNYPSKYLYNYNYKPFSTLSLEGSFVPFTPLLDVFPPSTSSVLPPVLGNVGIAPPSLPFPLPPSFLPTPSVKPPAVELPSSPVKPPTEFPSSSVKPPTEFPSSSVKPPTEFYTPQTSGFTSQFYPFYNSPYKYYSKFPLFYPFSTYPGNFFGEKEKPSPTTSYGPPASGPAENLAPTETSDSSSVSFPPDATNSDGSASDTSDQTSFTPAQEYGPPPSAKN